jgi:hypothetical protein
MNRSKSPECGSKPAHKPCRIENTRTNFDAAGLGKRTSNPTILQFKQKNAWQQPLRGANRTPVSYNNAAQTVVRHLVFKLLGLFCQYLLF